MGSLTRAAEHMNLSQSSRGTFGPHSDIPPSCRPNSTVKTGIRDRPDFEAIAATHRPVST